MKKPDDAGAVSGTVQTESQGTTVALIPEMRRRENRARCFYSTSGAAGHFLIHGNPPGDYKRFPCESIPAISAP